MAASLQEKLQELEELSKAQRQFVSDVSHELRTPMTTIRMAAEILFESREQLDPAAARSAELLQSQIERFETLLTDLLEISRHDANVATLDAELADISDIVRRSADDAQQLAERRGCRIEFRLPAQACMAEVDRRRVERILRNLLVNAVEYGEGRDVVVTVAADRDTVAIAVRDHGVGLGPGEELLVFERFWRADPSRARTVGGTGLGLAISLEDARLHGGWLQAWGEKGRGSVFRLTVPREAGQPLAGSPLPLARMRPRSPPASSPSSRPTLPAADVGSPVRRPLLAVLAVLATALAVTGCVSIPNAGPVLSYPVTEQTGGQNGQNLQFSAQPPGDGWTPQQIVSGFLIAAAANQNQVARGYLAPGESKRWNPASTTTTYVYKSRPNVLSSVPQPAVPRRARPAPRRARRRRRRRSRSTARSRRSCPPRTEPTRSRRRRGRTAPTRSTSTW